MVGEEGPFLHDLPFRVKHFKGILQGSLSRRALVNETWVGLDRIVSKIVSCLKNLLMYPPEKA